MDIELILNRANCNISKWKPQVDRLCHLWKISLRCVSQTLVISTTMYLIIVVIIIIIINHFLFLIIDHVIINIVISKPDLLLHHLIFFFPASVTWSYFCAVTNIHCKCTHQSLLTFDQFFFHHHLHIGTKLLSFKSGTQWLADGMYV